jgi:hypothetical protein
MANVLLSLSQSNSSPSTRQASTMTRVSSLSSTPDRIDLPFAMAAQINARLVMLYEPGTVMLPWIELFGGSKETA